LPGVKVVGLTGGIGSGKSTVSALLAERGAAIVDADAVVRELQEPGRPVFEAMVERFGPAIVAPDGTLDRQGVARIVFNDAEALAALNAIVHPAVRAELVARVQAHAGTDRVVVADMPLLDASSSSAVPLSVVVVVDVPVETQVERLVGHRGFDEADARARIGKQLAREERLATADFVIDNSGDPTALAAQVDELWAWLQTVPDTEF
jgi:dephospho-CoA kinase